MNNMNRWVKGLAAAAIAIGLMAGCSTGTESPVNSKPTEGNSVPSDKTIPSDKTAPSEGTGAGAGTNSGTGDMKAGDASKDSGLTGGTAKPDASTAPASK